MKQLVFVYGTLKSGYGNNRILKGSKLVAEATTEDDFLLTDTGFPYLIPQNALTATEGVTTAPVRGELWEVTSEDVMDNLDSLEGVAYDHYRHLELTVKTAVGKFTALAYACYNEGAQTLRRCPIENGEYVWGR